MVYQNLAIIAVFAFVFSAIAGRLDKVVGANLSAQSILVNTVVCTVTMCVVAHGITANVWANRISKKDKVQ